MALSWIKSLFTAKPDGEISSFISRARSRVDHTPDVVWLDRKRAHLVFVYDDTMRGFKNNKLLGESAYVGKALTHRNNFTVWKKKLGLLSYPIPIKNSNGSGGKVLGELWIVPTRQIILLDKYKRNGVLFTRQPTPVSFTFRRKVSGGLSEPVSVELEALMYVGKKPYWETQFDAGYSYTQLQVHHTRSDEPYFVFTPDDQKP